MTKRNNPKDNSNYSHRRGILKSLSLGIGALALHRCAPEKATCPETPAVNLNAATETLQAITGPWYQDTLKKMNNYYTSHSFSDPFGNSHTFTDSNVGSGGVPYRHRPAISWMPADEKNFRIRVAHPISEAHHIIGVDLWHYFPGMDVIHDSPGLQMRTHLNDIVGDSVKYCWEQEATVSDLNLNNQQTLSAMLLATLCTKDGVYYGTPALYIPGLVEKLL